MRVISIAVAAAGALVLSTSADAHKHRHHKHHHEQELRDFDFYNKYCEQFDEPSDWSAITAVCATRMWVTKFRDVYNIYYRRSSSSTGDLSECANCKGLDHYGKWPAHWAKVTRGDYECYYRHQALTPAAFNTWYVNAKFRCENVSAGDLG